MIPQTVGSHCGPEQKTESGCRHTDKVFHGPKQLKQIALAEREDTFPDVVIWKEGES